MFLSVSDTSWVAGSLLGAITPLSPGYQRTSEKIEHYQLKLCVRTRESLPLKVWNNLPSWLPSTVRSKVIKKNLPLKIYQ